MREGFFFMIQQIVKRDGRMAPFEIDKITNAIFGAAQASGGQDHDMAQELAEQVEKTLEETAGTETPTVEQVQDTVEKVLIESGHARTAKEYILYRAERTRVREMNTRLMKALRGSDLQGRGRQRRQARERQHRRRYRHGHHAQVRLGGRQAVLRDVCAQSGACQGPPGGRYPHPRPGFSHPDHHLLPDRPASSCSRTVSPPATASCGSPTTSSSYSALACIAIQSNQNDQHGGQSIAEL